MVSKDMATPNKILMAGVDMEEGSLPPNVQAVRDILAKKMMAAIPTISRAANKSSMTISFK